MKKRRIKKNGKVGYKRKFRIEHDALGKLKIPKDALYGIETQRALQNFPISGLKFQHEFVQAYILIKKASAIANKKLGKLKGGKADAIINACNLLLEGKWRDQIKVDVYQAGAGTSENMNINEVIANLALSIIKKKRGNYNAINPHDHVNLSQSTNDTFHSAIHISALIEIRKSLLPNLRKLEKALLQKAKQFQKTVKSGRTHLRDALPITLGQEFHTYATMIHENIKHIEDDSKSLEELNLGGTAIGTGVDAGRQYQRRVIKEISRATKIQFRSAKDLIEATASLGAIARTSASLKTLALDLIKIANDLRLLSSGPATGLDEISLPAVQPGSSIMPGKVNPVIPEMLDMVAFQVVGNDTTISLATQAGQLELNVMMPLAAYNLLNSIEVLSNAIFIFTEKCVKSIKANEKKCLEYLKKNPILVTALTPHIGYKKAAEIARQAYKEEKSVQKIVEGKKILSKQQLKEIFNYKKMTIMKK